MPRAHVALSEDNRPSLLEDAISCYVVDVVVRVDYELDGKSGQLADFDEKLLCGFGMFEGVDDGDAVVTDHEASVGASIAFGVVDGNPSVVA